MSEIPWKPLEAWIARLLKVPPAPEPPAGDPRSVETFRAAPAFFRYRLLGWGFKQAGALAGILIGLAFLKLIDWAPNPLDFIPFVDLENSAWARGFDVLHFFELLAVVSFLLQLPVSYLLICLDYRYRWYVTTDRSLRIREGLWNVREQTMTFSNVQNLSIRQGPVQRLLGIADLQVRTAGGGGGDEGGGETQDSADKSLHLGYFRGIANAAEIRDVILGHLRRLSAAGDRDEPSPQTRPAAGEATEPEPEPEVLAAARDVLRETRALASAVSAAAPR